ncbi:Hypothetical predicted protein [Olea europaea subsp. europaea]|uniref:Uncharacterized protein n=1 Tax=Olea europaea subsp. europaea TaxID=158383 RepID=A0A8S0SQ47_OLEEU|nr:Hypothetical predicted protein [Olea europaea subsp. europaea]
MSTIHRRTHSDDDHHPRQQSTAELTVMMTLTRRSSLTNREADHQCNFGGLDGEACHQREIEAVWGGGNFVGLDSVFVVVDLAVGVSFDGVCMEAVFMAVDLTIEADLDPTFERVVWFSQYSFSSFQVELPSVMSLNRSLTQSLISDFVNREGLGFSKSGNKKRAPSGYTIAGQ